MGKLRWLAITLLASGCTYYAGISKTADGKVYITGTTNFFVFATSFVKKCTESGTTLTCEAMTVTDSGAGGKGGDDEEEAPKKKKKKGGDDDDGGDDTPKKKKKPAADE
jgi:hypothetical protein